MKVNSLLGLATLAAVLLLRQAPAWSGTDLNAAGPRYEPFEARPLYPQIALTDLNRGCVLLETGLRCWGWNESIRELEKFKNITQIMGMPYALCVLAEGTVHCWKNKNEKVEQPFPDVRDATKIVATEDNELCATTPNGPRCTGGSMPLENVVKWLTDTTRKIFHHDGMACLVRPEMESKKACQVVSGFDWGAFQFIKYKSTKCDEVCFWSSTTIAHEPGPGRSPVLKDKAVQVLTDQCVASPDGKVGCFSLPLDQDNIKPYFKALQTTKVIKSIVRGRTGSDYCAITDKGLECWDKNDQEPLYRPTGVSNPRQLISIIGKYCVLDDKGVLCWDRWDRDSAKRLSDSRADSSSILVADSSRVCLLREEGIQCWKDSRLNAGITPIEDASEMPPQEIQELIRIRRLAPEALAETLPRLGEEVYAEKRVYFASVATALKDLEKEYGKGASLESAQILTFFALEPIITQLDSPIFVRSHIPNYKRMQHRLGKEKGISSLSQVPASMANVRMAARMLHAALTSTSRFWPSEDNKQAAADLQRKLGVFLAKPKPNAFVLQELVQDLKEGSVFEGLVQLPRTKSLGLTAMAVTEWLATAAD